jgi:DNA polymerase I-like protein with 3'-5' exonuclease and polymerase domains
MHHPEATMTASQQGAVAQKYCELLAKVPIVGANLRFDMHWSRFKLGARKWNIVHDTQLMQYAIYLGTQLNGLKHLTTRYLRDESGYEDEMDAFLETLKESERHYDNISASMLTKYAGHDVDVVIQLIPILKAELAAHHQLDTYDLFLMHPYAAFIEMEQNGAFIDAGIVSDLLKEYEEKVAEPLAWFKEHSPYWPEWERRRIADAKEKRSHYKQEKTRNKPILQKELDINFGSPEQIAELLFSIVGLEVWGDVGKPKKKLMKIFPGGVPSTKEEALANIQENLFKSGEISGPRTDILEKIMAFRKDAKILSGYLKKAFEHCPVLEVPDWWESRATLGDSRQFEAELYGVHCQSASYNLTKTRTGRTSSSEPNSQQVTWRMRRMYPARPIKKGELKARRLDAKKNRRRLIANFDVGQAELRMLAVASQDESFLAVMRDPSRDIHKEISSLAYRKAISEVTKSERTNTKSIVFGTIFGRSPQAVAAELKISVDEAKRIQDSLFEMMPTTKMWIDSKHAEGQDTGQVITPTGRIRDLRSYSNKGERNRRAVNTPIQGGASDLTLWATGWIHKEMKKYGKQSLLWNFVHDSVVFDLFPSEAEYLMQLSRHCFSVMTPQQFPWYNVPLVLDFQFGVDWMRQVEAEYAMDTRVFKLEGSAADLTPVFETFEPLLTDVTVDPDWVAKAGHLDTQGKPDPQDVWISGKFF